MEALVVLALILGMAVVPGLVRTSDDHQQERADRVVPLRALPFVSEVWAAEGKIDFDALRQLSDAERATVFEQLRVFYLGVLDTLRTGKRTRTSLGSSCLLTLLISKRPRKRAWMTTSIWAGMTRTMIGIIHNDCGVQE